MNNIFEDELFGDVPSSNEELVSPVPSITPTSDGNYQTVDHLDNSEDNVFELPEEDDNIPESTVPKNSQKPVTNIEFLSRMLHPALRSYLRENQKWLRSSFSESLLSLFMDICTKIEDESISPEVLDAMLPDLGVSDLRKDIIVRNYKLITEDTTMCLAKTTYEKFREIVYKAYFDSVNEGNAVETLEAIQNSDFFLPPFGIINSDTFKQVKFGDFDMQSIMEDLGSPLYSHFAELNEISPINGYIPSQVTMISGPPGCFVGGTKIRQPNGTLKTIYQMYEAKEPATVMYLEDDGKVDWTWKNEGVQKTGSGTEFTKVYVNTMNVPIVATRNHQFLVMMWRVDDSQPDLHTDIQLRWVEAQKLKEGDILVSHPMNKYVKVQKVENVTYRKPVAYYDVVENKNHNYYINAGEEDICVHNSGKTILMMNEAVEALRQGKKVLYAAIGDLKPYDFASRICSMLMKMPMTKTAMSLASVYDSAVRLYPYLKENLTVQFISPDKYTPGQWFKLLESMGAIKDNDVFFIDYDTNFATERDSMYSKGDEVYTMAYTLSQIPGKYVFIGSQPKIGNWKDQELGLETASESSRKQQIVDVMITLSVDRDVKNPNNHMGTINVPKNRRGGTTKFKYFLDPTGIVVPVTSEAYLAIRDEHVPVSVVDTEFYDMNTKLMPNALKDAKKGAETVTDDGEIISE